VRGVYYWAEQPNFGDALALPLLEHFSQADWCYQAPEDAEVVVTGSILEHLPSNWEGIVAGAGKLHEGSSVSLKQARILGVRGMLTREALGARNAVLGDPGLLASELVPVDRETVEWAVIPHWSDQDLFPRELANAQRYGYAEPLLIDPTNDPLEVVRTIGACKKIVSSSLHGLVVAASFGIPCRAEPFPLMDSIHEGGMFKHLDHASAIGQKFEFGVLQTANRQNVERCQAEIFDMLKSISDVL
jgi:hypothetical protein